MSGLRKLLQTTKQELELRLQHEYAYNREDAFLEATYSAMRYMMFLGGGGKRIRPLLVIAANLACGGRADGTTWSIACGVEEIHTYALILDDIQDKSDLRRGLPSCHARYGANTAILAAMRLYERGLEPFHRLTSYSGRIRPLLDALHRGQAADLEATTWPPEKLTIENLRFIHGGKTSALFQLACLGGAALAQASAPTIDAVLNYAYFLGLAFQAKDDILDVTSTPEVLGKPTQADTAMTKLTYPTLLGSIGAAQVEAVELAEIAISELRKVFGPGAEVLEELARYSVNREK